MPLGKESVEGRGTDGRMALGKILGRHVCCESRKWTEPARNRVEFRDFELAVLNSYTRHLAWTGAKCYRIIHLDVCHLRCINDPVPIHSRALLNDSVTEQHTYVINAAVCPHELRNEHSV